MNLAFKKGKAEFPDLAKSDGVYISKVLHKAFIEVILNNILFCYLKILFKIKMLHKTTQCIVQKMRKWIK